VALVAALAASLGAGVSWRTRRTPSSTSAEPSPASSGAVGVAAPAAASAGPAAARPPGRIVTTDGRVLTPADWQGRPLVLNFWAPWCGPCVKEMPELDRFAKAQAAMGAKGALVVGLAIDEEAAVTRFLAAHPVSFPISILGFPGLAQVRALGNDPNVALPFTAVFGADGTLSHRKFGPTDVDELGRWVRGGT
jgi:thiol-disulfide isomerase/thioredoxin